MTNEKKYKNTEERIKAFREYCTDHECVCCEINVSGEGVTGCAIRWLALESEDEKPESCPFCGGECRAVKNRCEAFVVGCDTCCYASQDFERKDAAIAAHNRVARAVRAAKESEVK